MKARPGLLVLPFILGACGFFANDKVENVPLSKNSEAKYTGEEDWPALQSKGSDALRVLIRPSFGRYNYRFDFVPLKAGCRIYDAEIDRGVERPESSYCGEVAVTGYRTDTGAEFAATPFRFVVPAADFGRLFENLQHRMARWRGTRKNWTDGTSIAVELHNRGKISSMVSNDISPENPMQALSAPLQAMILAYGPSGMFPRSSDWHSFVDPDRPCDTPGINEKDADGFGIGDDACAIWLRSKATER